MSNEGGPSLKWWKLISTPHPGHGQESSQICHKINHRDFSNPWACAPGPQRTRTNPWGASPTPPHVPLMQCCVFQATSGSQEPINSSKIFYIADYNRLNYAKNTWVYCHVTCNCQSELSPRSPRWMCKSPVLHGPRYAPSLIGLEGTTICIPSPDWWLGPALFPQGRTQRYKKGSQAESCSLVWRRPTLTSGECTILSFFNKSSVCLCCYWAVPSLLFKILAARPEPRNPACLSCN